jgi:hypothetical protein
MDSLFFPSECIPLHLFTIKTIFIINNIVIGNDEQMNIRLAGSETSLQWRSWIFSTSVRHSVLSGIDRSETRIKEAKYLTRVEDIPILNFDGMQEPISFIKYDGKRIKWKKYQSIGTAPKFKTKFSERDKIDSPNTYTHDRTLSWIGTSLQEKAAGLN